VRKSEAAAEHERRAILRARSRKGGTADVLALEAAGYFVVVTSLPRELLAAGEVLHICRFRWQIEMAFKRLKGLIHLDELTARDPTLAHTFLYAKLLATLLLEDFTKRFLAISPWGFRLD
jgi:IS4 transposase